MAKRNRIFHIYNVIRCQDYSMRLPCFLRKLPLLNSIFDMDSHYATKVNDPLELLSIIFSNKVKSEVKEIRAISSFALSLDVIRHLLTEFQIGELNLVSPRNFANFVFRTERSNSVDYRQAHNSFHLPLVQLIEFGRRTKVSDMPAVSSYVSL